MEGEVVSASPEMEEGEVEYIQGELTGRRWAVEDWSVVKSVTVRHLWGKLGMLLQRGNAAILANRVPTFPAPAIDGQH